MWQRSLRTCAVLIITFFAVSVLVRTYVRSALSPEEGDVAVPVAAVLAAPSSTPPRVDAPDRLSIPDLHIDAHVQKVGVTKKGTLGIPSNFSDVAWYRDGVAPGMNGSAIIDGHVDNGLGLAGVFKHLHDIRPGQKIYITTESKTIIEFTVTSIDHYNYKSTNIADLFRTTGPPTLRLITCEGEWIAAARTYSDRLVVTAVRAN